MHGVGSAAGTNLLPALVTNTLLQAARPGAKIGCSIVEAFSKEVR